MPVNPKSLKNLKPFEKGNRMNPGGKPKVPDDIKEMRKLTSVELERIINKLIHSDISELSLMLKEKKDTVIVLMVARLLHDVLSKGDHQKYSLMVDRLVGKIKEQIEVTTVKPFIIESPAGDTITMGLKDDKT